MASQVVDYPTGHDAYLPATFAMRVQDFVLMSPPDGGLAGPIRTMEIPGSRLVVEMSYGEQQTVERALVLGLWSKAGMRRNRVRLWHFALPAPRGTMRASPLLNASAAAGAESVSIKSMSGTLLRGDVIGLADGLHIVTDDAAPAGGIGTVSISPQVRYAIAADSAVVWDRPTQTFVVTAVPAIPFQGGRGGHPGFTITLVEAPA